jgi:hypothetical protein
MAIIAFFLVSFIPGCGLYLWLHKEHSKHDLIGFSIIYSICFTPVLLYLLRLINLGNNKPMMILVLILPMILYVIHKTITKANTPLAEFRKEMFLIPFVLTLFCFIPILMVNQGFLNGTIFYNGVFDDPKHYGTLISVYGSSGLKIDNPFVSGYRMYYYFFYYFKSSAFMTLSGSGNTYEITTIAFILDRLTIAYSYFYMFFKIGDMFNRRIPIIGFICFLLFADGGFDILYIYYHLNNSIAGGYVDAWVRELYKLPVKSLLVHSNFLIKLIWQPQHSAAFIPVMVIIITTIKRLKETVKLKEYTIICSLCLFSLLGYSALVALPSILVISCITAYLIVNKKIQWKYTLYLPMGALLSVPLLYLYVSNKGSSGGLNLQDPSDLFMMIKFYPFTTLSRVIGEFGIIAILFLMCIITVVKERKISIYHQTLLISIIISGIILLTVQMSWINDIGMATSSLFYLLLFFFVMISDTEWLLKRSIVPSLIAILMIPCMYTNVQGVLFHNTSKIPLTEVKKENLELSSYFRNHVSVNDVTVFVSKDPNIQDMNRLVPMLLHTKTFYPLVEGMQYLNDLDRQKVKPYWDNFKTMKYQDQIEQLRQYKVNFLIFHTGSEEQLYFTSSSKPIYSNNVWTVYKL